MKTTRNFRKFLIQLFLWIYILTNIIPIGLVIKANSDNIVFPLKEISKLDCRFEEFWKLSSNCKMKVLILKSKDYNKYINKDGWYNDYTRLYTVLWGSSYKYGWDVWHWGHIWTDIATSKWTPVYAIADWEIKIAKNTLWLWNTISINHTIRGKFISSNYGHLSKILVKKWQWVKAGSKIWEVWSTWNSTWNHLHFQIDLDTTFHPYYYWRKECPYSYYDITEKWVCFDELQNNTIDPIVFFETKWAILDKVKITTNKVTINKTNNSNDTNKTIVNTAKNNSWYDDSIFDRTVYTWYDYNDIKEVQRIYKDLSEYTWWITWDYKDIENSIISYQISNNIITDKSDLWAGWFWPKTRNQTKNDYANFLKNWWKRWNYDEDIVVESTSNSKIDNSAIKVDKIDRKNILTREEIEQREIDSFLRNNTIELSLKDVWWNIQVWKTLWLDLYIKTRRWAWFKWNMPKWITFSVDSTKVRVFPEKLYYFTDWKRDIKLTWLKEGNTVLYVKIWNKVIKTFKLNVFKSWKVTYPESWLIHWSNSMVIWDNKTWIVLFKDDNKKNLINFSFWWTYQLKTNSSVEVCVKRWNLNNIKKIYKTSCLEKDYKSNVNFSYDDTVWWLLLFDYKVSWKDAKIELVNNYNKKVFYSKKILAKKPNGLKWDYAYKTEVLDMLEKWIVWWINKWYFLENRELTQSDANNWILNTLRKLEADTIDNNVKAVIKSNIDKINREVVSKFNPITRKDFLDRAYTYLVFDKTPPQISIEYRDLESWTNSKVNTIFNKSSTWKDKFWENYYRPEIKMTRWEWAYFLSKVLEKNAQIYLSSK